MAANVNKKVTLIPERSKVIENRRLNKRQTTLRAFTFIRDWELRVSPIPRSVQQGSETGSSQVSSSSPFPLISPGPAAIGNASPLSQRSQTDESISSGPTVSHPMMQHSRSKIRQRKLVGHSSIKSMLESTRLSDRNSSPNQDAASQSSHLNVSAVGNDRDGKISPNIINAPSLLSQPHASAVESAEESEPASENLMHGNAIKEGLSNSGTIGKRSGARRIDESRAKTTAINISRIQQVQNDENVERAEESEPASEISMHGNAVEDGSSDSGVTGRRSARLIEASVAKTTARNVSQSHQEDNDEDVDIDANLSNTPNRLKEGSVVATTSSMSALVVQTSPKSGPAYRKKGSLKRRSPDEGRKANDKTDPLPKGKVCLWTASDRNRSASDVTELDVILSNIEEVCLDYREELTEKRHRTAVAKFFLNTKKDFTDMIALRQEQKFLQSSVKKARSNVHKKRKLLLSLQQENARLTLDIDHQKKEKADDKNQILGGISEFLEGLRDLQMKANQLQVHVDDSINHKNNIPALLMESTQLSKVDFSLQSSSRKRKKWQEKSN